MAKKRSHRARKTRLKATSSRARARLVATVRRRIPGEHEIARDIDRRIAAYKKSLSAVAKRSAALKASSAKTLNIVAHGDSWFDYPVSYDEHPTTDITVWLEEKLIKPKPRILKLAHYGDGMLESFGTKKRNRLIAALQAAKFDAILFSGGGNDIIGDNLHLFLNDAATVGKDPARAINDVAFGSALSFVANYYRELVAIRNAHAPGVPIFLHGYDFARPTNRGVLGCLVGPWLFPALRARGWMKKPSGGDLAVGAGIVRRMLERFDTLLRSEIAAKFSDVIVVQTQGTITQPGLWDNETHLKADGFFKIAERFASAIKARLS